MNTNPHHHTINASRTDGNHGHTVGSVRRAVIHFRNGKDMTKDIGHQFDHYAYDYPAYEVECLEIPVSGKTVSEMMEDLYRKGGAVWYDDMRKLWFARTSQYDSNFNRFQAPRLFEVLRIVLKDV